MNLRMIARIAGTAILVSTTGLSQSSPQIPAQGRRGNPATARPVQGRSIVATQLGIVAASHPLAAQAGVELLERGGNAVDAAIAANAAMGLMEPAMNGI